MQVLDSTHVVPDMPTPPRTTHDRPRLWRRDCRCEWCGRTALHVVKTLRKNDPHKQIRSHKAAREIDATAELARALRTGA